MKTTTVALDRELVQKLRSLGKKGETYSQIIWRLLESVEASTKHDA